jgi:molybdate transport system ATP-binding protein
MLLEMNVTLRRGRFGLATQLSVNEASVGLFGKSGAGKSTVFGLISGALQPQSGRIVLNGKILFDSARGIVMPRELRPVGAVAQIDGANSGETVRENLVAAYHRTLKQRRIFKPGFITELLELGPILNSGIGCLSAGERQRVALARSLLKSPQLLLLDETFAAIGTGYRLRLLPILERLRKELDLPIWYASQSLGEILELTDHLIVLEQGKVLHKGSLLEAVKHQGLLRYLGIRPIDNVLTVTVCRHEEASGCTLAHSFGLPLILPLRPHYAAGTQTQVSIRANDIALASRYIDGISIQNQIKGRICALIPRGESVIVQIDCGGTLLAEITPRACQDLGLREGLDIYCLIKTHSIVYLSELDEMSRRCIVSRGGDYYYLNAPPSGGGFPLLE